MNRTGLRGPLLCCIVLSLGASGCATRGAVIATAAPASDSIPAHVELDATPFFPQRRYQCGPAALATALGASGVPVTADELADRVYLPGKQGSLQTELIAASRGFDRMPYRVRPELGAVVSELAAGRPVLVLQNLGV